MVVGFLFVCFIFFFLNDSDYSSIKKIQVFNSLRK